MRTDNVVTVALFDAKYIIDFANELGGEQAIEDCVYLCDTSEDDIAKGCALQSLTTFYANVRNLVRMLNTNLIVKP